MFQNDLHIGDAFGVECAQRAMFIDKTRFSLCSEALNLTCFFVIFMFFLAESGGERAKTRVRTLVHAKSLKYIEDLCLFPSGALREIR